MPKVIKHNYYALPGDEEIKKNFKTELHYCNDIDINGRTWAVYYTKNPTKEQNYKHFLLFSVNFLGDIILSVKSKDELQPHRLVSAVHCDNCDTVIYSPNVHVMVWCECKSVAIDGGSRYSKIAHTPGWNMFKIITLDVITEIIIPEELI